MVARYAANCSASNVVPVERIEPPRPSERSEHLKAVGSVASELLDEAEFPIEIGLHRGRRVVGALVGPLVDVVDVVGGAISQIGDGECREFMLCTKRIWQGVLWIATSAMAAFSHEGEGRTSFVCATVVN
jgi:hypothetical protein